MTIEPMLGLRNVAVQAPASIPLPPADVDTLDLQIEFGRTRIGQDQVAALRTGSVVPLDNAAADPVDVYADGRLIARAELVAINGHLGARVVELLSKRRTCAA